MGKSPSDIIKELHSEWNLKIYKGDVYDFIDGNWVLIDEDHFYKEEYDPKEFYESNMLFYEFLNILGLPIYVYFRFVEIINKIL